MPSFGAILFLLYNNYLHKSTLIHFDILKWFLLNLDCIAFLKYSIKYSIIFFFLLVMMKTDWTSLFGVTGYNAMNVKWFISHLWCFGIIFFVYLKESIIENLLTIRWWSVTPQSCKSRLLKYMSNTSYVKYPEI